MTRAEQLIAWARTELGSPYIFGAAGQKCTPAYRQQVMKKQARVCPDDPEELPGSFRCNPIVRRMQTLLNDMMDDEKVV